MQMLSAVTIKRLKLLFLFCSMKKWKDHMQKLKLQCRLGVLLIGSAFWLKRIKEWRASILIGSAAQNPVLFDCTLKVHHHSSISSHTDFFPSRSYYWNTKIFPVITAIQKILQKHKKMKPLVCNCQGSLLRSINLIFSSSKQVCSSCTSRRKNKVRKGLPYTKEAFFHQTFL